jgi:hypothetical protein
MSALMGLGFNNKGSSYSDIVVWSAKILESGPFLMNIHSNS